MRVLFIIPRDAPPRLEGPFSDAFASFVDACLQVGGRRLRLCLLRTAAASPARTITLDTAHTFLSLSLSLLASLSHPPPLHTHTHTTLSDSGPTLQKDPGSRPSADALFGHPFIAGAPSAPPPQLLGCISELGSRRRPPVGARGSDGGGGAYAVRRRAAGQCGARSGCSTCARGLRGRHAASRCCALTS